MVDYVICQVTKKRINISDAKLIGVIRPGVLELIKKAYPKIEHNGYISTEVLKKFRQQYIESVLAKEKGDLSKLDKEVVKSMVHHETLSRNINSQFDKKLSTGAKVADKVAEFGGSWKFIILFGAVIFAWIVINTILLMNKPFDPYPFLLLNIMLSCLAAIQAPVIMMSQNRKEAKDRLRSENDYKVNLKAELEIRILHEKLDNLIQHQWQRLLEIQQLQMDMMEEKTKNTNKRSK
jgi:uncharacterized membrane protein